MSAAKSPARSAGVPPSSPRLPSPPPLPELQLGPRSPLTGELHLDSIQQDDGASRRVRPGTSAIEMAKGPPFVPLHQLESPFQLQEYLKSSYCTATRDDSDTVKPITKDTALQLATPPIQSETGDPVDKHLWLYELCRFLVQRTNRLIVSFFSDDPPCSSQTCPEMRASEWQYLCAVHEPPKSCCAIDYCCHTLDWAANILTSTRHFPSRLALGGDGMTAAQSMKQLTNIFRRVYRIYAHAWFQHRERFWMLEQEEGLYKFFKTVSDVYRLIPEDNYTVPPEAEGEREEVEEKPEISVLRHDTALHIPQLPKEDSTTVQRRHRSTPSTGAPINSIAEAEEEEEPKASKPMNIPIADMKQEDIGVPEDPTPTPERHDPFDGTAQVVLADELEPPTPLTAVEPLKLPKTETRDTIMPSVRTVDDSGLVRHEEKDEKDEKDNMLELTASPEKLSEADLKKARSQAQSQIQAQSQVQTPPQVPIQSEQSESAKSSHQVTEPEEATIIKGEGEGEDDEEMGEIALEKTTTAIKEVDDKDEQPEPEKEADPVVAKDEEEEKKETPSGVV